MCGFCHQPHRRRWGARLNEPRFIHLSYIHFFFQQPCLAPSLPRSSHGLPRLNLGLGAISLLAMSWRYHTVSFRLEENQWVYERAISLERAEGRRPIGHMLLGVPGPVACGLDGVLVRRRINGIGDPSVPERLDVTAAAPLANIDHTKSTGRRRGSGRRAGLARGENLRIIVVLGIVDPSCSDW